MNKQNESNQKGILALKEEKHYEHYAKCQLPIENCLICRFVFGNLTQEEQTKYKEALSK